MNKLRGFKIGKTRKEVPAENMRVFELAKELDIKSEHILSITKKLKIKAKSHMSLLYKNDVKTINENYLSLMIVIKKENRKNMIKNTPKSKECNISKFKKELADLAKDMDDLKTQQTAAALLVPYILEEYEGFKTVKKTQEHKGLSCEFLGFKDGARYIIEFKCFFDRYITPDKKQKIEFQKILDTNKNLEIVLLQLKINKSQYRVFDKKYMKFLLQV
jgi:hypothetical protein